VSKCADLWTVFSPVVQPPLRRRELHGVAATPKGSDATWPGVQTPQVRLTVAGCDLLVLGTVPGFAPDGDRVAQAFAAFLPEAVALGVPPEDLHTLEALAKADPRPELPEPDEVTGRLLELLAKFGPTAVPSPDLDRATALAREANVPIVAIDVDDAVHSALYTRHVKFRHVVQSNGVKSRLLKQGVDGPDAYALAKAWDAAWTKPKGLRLVEEAREQHMARRLTEEAAGRRRLMAVLPAVRMEAVVAQLRAPSAKVDTGARPAAAR
jgi:hypothetical protein